MVAPAENHNATLLIVDDDAAARDRLRDIFETAQYRVVTATEAASALRVLKGVRCDLVALDLEMPGVDGLALCKLLRAQPTTSKLPIIALSESDVGAWFARNSFGAAVPRGGGRIVLRDHAVHATAVPCHRLRGTRSANS